MVAARGEPTGDSLDWADARARENRPSGRGACSPGVQRIGPAALCTRLRPLCEAEQSLSQPRVRRLRRPARDALSRTAHSRCDAAPRALPAAPLLPALRTGSIVRLRPQLRRRWLALGGPRAPGGRCPSASAAQLPPAPCRAPFSPAAVRPASDLPQSGCHCAAQAPARWGARRAPAPLQPLCGAPLTSARVQAGGAAERRRAAAATAAPRDTLQEPQQRAARAVRAQFGGAAAEWPGDPGRAGRREGRCLIARVRGRADGALSAPF